MRTFKTYFSVLTLMLGGLIACSGGDDAPAPTPPVEIAPKAATLLTPENNSECLNGEVVPENELESEVLFEWKAGENTSSFILELKDLTTNSTRTIKTIATSLNIRIVRGRAYSWSVTSIGSGSSSTVKSSVWKFYNSGIPQESYPPYPAEATKPTNGAGVDAGIITLEWEGSDMDGDIASYEVYFGLERAPETLWKTTGSTSTSVEVTSGNVYYWKVVTIDQKGNTSDSQVFQFSVN